jgi:hypothetical protein
MNMMDDEMRWIAPFRELIERALAEGYGQLSYQDVITGINKGEYQFWAAENSCVVTTIDVFPQMKQLTIILGAGDLAEIDTKIRPLIEDWAREIKCDALIIFGRPGWQRALEGYRRTAVVLEKRL